MVLTWKLSYGSSLWTASLKMAAERYLSRRIPDLRVGNDIDKIDKKPIPSSLHPWLFTDLGKACPSRESLTWKICLITLFVKIIFSWKSLNLLYLAWIFGHLEFSVMGKSHRKKNISHQIDRGPFQETGCQLYIKHVLSIQIILWKEQNLPPWPYAEHS